LRGRPVVHEGARGAGRTYRPPPEGVRLSKVMSERGMCSRREADLWIERGWVFVDGEQVSELGRVSTRMPKSPFEGGQEGSGQGR
jgi:hypothetical protein